MTDLFEPNYESEFNLIMDMFGHPYECYKSKQIKVSDFGGGNERIYDFTTSEGMKQYYLKECVNQHADLIQRVENLLEMMVNFPNHEMLQYLSVCVANDLMTDFEDIDGIKNN